MSKGESAKPFCIPKRDVWNAYKRVKANRGAAGIDGQSLAEFEENLSTNLYKLWNRLSSGSYFPMPVRRVEIPKGDGKTRPLGIPTVTDRIAQMVVTQFLQPLLVSGAGGLHPRALSEPYVNLSIHTAPALQPAIPKVAQWAKSAV
jgi:hypothetical protein